MGVTIFISCMGLFGLGLFTTRRRAKEISIRKVLGASVASITTLLSKDFAWLVGLCTGGDGGDGDCAHHGRGTGDADGEGESGQIS